MLQPHHAIHHEDPLANPPDNFELTPHDFDIDAELIPSSATHMSHGFVLKSKDEGRCTCICYIYSSPKQMYCYFQTVSAEREAQKKKRMNDDIEDLSSSNRFSLLGMEVSDYTAHAPMIAPPAALGYGPAVAMPTLMGMMPEMKDFEESTDGDGSHDGLDLSTTALQVPLKEKSPGVRGWLHACIVSVSCIHVCMYVCV